MNEPRVGHVSSTALALTSPPPPSQAGLIEEMVEDALEGVEDEGLEEEADAEVEKILYEVTSGEWLVSIALPPVPLTTLA